MTPPARFVDNIGLETSLSLEGGGLHNGKNVEPSISLFVIVQRFLGH